MSQLSSAATDTFIAYDCRNDQYSDARTLQNCTRSATSVITNTYDDQA